MRFGEKLVILLFRPIYRTFFERLIWWFLTRAKVFFLAEVIPSLTDITARLERIEQRLGGHTGHQNWPEMRDHLRLIEANSEAQWKGLEALLLAMFRQTELQHSESGQKLARALHANGSELREVNASNHLR